MRDFVKADVFFPQPICIMEKIDAIVYINLDKREDRREEIEDELQRLHLSAERFPAILHDPGIVGCGKSHLSVMKTAKERGYKNILILEDDFVFLVDELMFTMVTHNVFTDLRDDYDVCMFCYQNLVENTTAEKKAPYLKRVYNANNASAYLINGDYLDVIIKLYEDAIPKLEQTGEHWNYANDQVWTQLQERDRWYCVSPRIGKQRSGYSDNAKSFMDYDT